MAFRTNINSQDRGFWFAESGNNDFDGRSLERPKQTIQAAIDAAAALDPPPSGADIAVIQVAQGGEFDESITLVDGVNLLARGASIVDSSSTQTIELASTGEVDLSAVISNQPNSIGVLGDNLDLSAFTCQLLEVIGTDSIAIDVIGTADEVFFDITRLRVSGEGGRGIRIQSTQTTPMDFDLDSVGLEANNTTFIEYSPTLISDETTVTVSSITNKTPLGTFTGTTAFLCSEGQLTANVGSIEASVAVEVKANGVLNLSAARVVGDIIVNAGGQLNCNIVEHDGVITNNGVIEGRIGGQEMTDRALVPITIGQTVALNFTGADAGEFLTLGDLRQYKDVQAFNVRSLPITAILYQETFENNNDVALDGVFEIVVSGTTVNEYRANTSFVEGVFLLENDVNRIRQVEYAAFVGGIQQGSSQTAFVPAREGNVNGEYLVTFSEAIGTTIPAGSNTSLRARQVDGANVVVKGTEITSSYTLAQTSDIRNVTQVIEEVSANQELERNYHYLITGGTAYTLPPASDFFESDFPEGPLIKNLTDGDVTLTADGSDMIADIFGLVSSITIKPNEAVFLLAATSTEWDVLGVLRRLDRTQLLSGSSFVDQNPTGTDSPRQIEFGAAQGTGADPVQLAADGTVTCNEKGQYIFDITIQYGRVGSGGVSILVFRALINGSQVGISISAKLDGSNDDIPFQVSGRRFDLEVGDTVTFEFLRDSTGNDSGGLVTFNPTLAGWDDVPSATLRVSR